MPSKPVRLVKPLEHLGVVVVAAVPVAVVAAAAAVAVDVVSATKI